MVVRHRHGVAVPVESAAARLVGLYDGGVGGRSLALEPAQECGPEVEAQPLESVDDPPDVTLGVQDAAGHDRPVALALDAVVPIVVRAGRRLARHLLQPRILTGRLIEMPVDDDGEGSPPQAGAAQAALWAARAFAYTSR